MIHHNGDDDANSERIIPWTSDVDVVMRPTDIAYINGLDPNDNPNDGYDDIPLHDNDEESSHDHNRHDANHGANHIRAPIRSSKIIDRRKPVTILYGTTLQRYMWLHGIAWFYDSIWRGCARRGGALATSLSPDYDITMAGERYAAPYLDLYRGGHTSYDNNTCVMISRCVYERSFIYPLANVTIDGMQFPSPAQPHSVLKQDYGPFYLLTPTEMERSSADIEQSLAVCDNPVTIAVYHTCGVYMASIIV